MAYLTIFTGFADIARDNNNQSILLFQELKDSNIKRKNLSEEDLELFHHEEFLPLRLKFENHCIITIIFSALAVEGYINYYATNNFSDNFIKQHIEKLDLLSKWVLLPQLVTSNKFPRDGEAFQSLKQLIKDRNYLVHNKTARLEIYDQSSDSFTMSSKAKKMLDFGNNLFDKSNNAIRAMDTLSLAMEDIDPNASTSFHLRAPVGQRKLQTDRFG